MPKRCFGWIERSFALEKIAGFWLELNVVSTKGHEVHERRQIFGLSKETQLDASTVGSLYGSQVRVSSLVFFDFFLLPLAEGKQQPCAYYPRAARGTSSFALLSSSLSSFSLLLLLL
jgi:hypothetical protein